MFDTLLQVFTSDAAMEVAGLILVAAGVPGAAAVKYLGAAKGAAKVIKEFKNPETPFDADQLNKDMDKILSKGQKKMIEKAMK